MLGAALSLCLMAGIAEVRVEVWGEVQLPGEHVLSLGSRLLQALSAAGGMLPTADASRVILERTGCTDRIPVDLHRLTTLGDLTQNYTLLDGDRIVVARIARTSVWIRAGSVMRPVEFEAGLTVLETLRRADWRPSGDTERVRVETSASGATRVQREFTLRQLLRMEPEVQRLAPGDVITVGKGTLRSVVGESGG